MDTQYRHEPEDEDEDAVHEWTSLGHGIYLIRVTYPDGTGYVTWATSNPGGGFQIHIAC